MISHLLADPTIPAGAPACRRADAGARTAKRKLLPDDDTLLKPGDRILFVGEDRRAGCSSVT